MELNGNLLMQVLQTCTIHGGILLKKGYGTLMYKGKWNLFDQIVFTGNLLGTDRSTLKFYKHEIFSRDFMFQKKKENIKDILNGHRQVVYG